MKRLQVSNIVIETDCLEVVQVIAEQEYTHVQIEGIIADIRTELQLLPYVTLQHTPRLCNKVAHCLANFAYEACTSSTWLDHPPDFIRDLIEFDCKHMG